MSRLRYRERRTYCGEYLEVNIYPLVETTGRNNRKKRRAVSSEAMEQMNQRNREREVNRVICENFTDDDLYLTLTYKIACVDRTQALRDFSNFIKRLNRLRKRRGLPAVRWLKTIEGGNGKRIHIHCIITGGVSPQEIGAAWGNGYIDCKPLVFDNTGCKDLAEYLVKQAGIDTKDKGGTSRSKARRWSCSRNCTRPKPIFNDSKYSKRKVSEIADRARVDDRRALDVLFDGYECTDAKPYYRDDFGLEYIYLTFRRKAEPHTKSRRSRPGKTKSKHERSLRA